jgi:hypothetical protein
MPRNCPSCQNEVDNIPYPKRSTHIDFICAKCGEPLRLDVTLPILLAVICGSPLLIYSYSILPNFTFYGGDGLIVGLLGLLFWPLGKLKRREEKRDENT